jgi:site-specific DNA recombinase
VAQGDWKPVLDIDTHQRLVALLTDPSRRTAPASSAIKYLLSGLARCGVCTGPMRVLTAGKDGRKSDSYVCQHGYHVRRSRDGLDALVTGLVTARLARPDAAVLLPGRDDGQAQEAADRAAALRARLDTAADAYAEGAIDDAQLTRITANLRPELEKWQQVAHDTSAAPDLLDLAEPTSPDTGSRCPSRGSAASSTCCSTSASCPRPDTAVTTTRRTGGRSGRSRSSALPGVTVRRVLQHVLACPAST